MGRVHVREAEQALREAHGCVAAAARKLGIGRTTLHRYIRNSPRLQIARDDGRAALVGEAHSGLVEAVRDRKPWAIMFVLARLGRDEGFAERVELDVVHPEAEYDW